jgi:hypothetical protein
MQLDQLSGRILATYQGRLYGGMEIYEIDGRCLFPNNPMYNGLRCEVLLYLIKRGNDDGTGWYSYCIKLSPYKLEDFEYLAGVIVNSALEFKKYLQEGVARPLNPDGGTLGTGDDNKVEGK